MAKNKTPIALLCGYLGAGKTTLMNQILTNQKGYKVAVIVNDIGEVNVDADLIANGAKITDTSSIVPLTNGCICCTLKSDMAQNIENLIKTGKYDYILIEASGVCEPMPIAQELEMIKGGRLDNVIGVVDASRLVEEFAGGDALLKEKNEEDIESLLVQQIEFCSTLVINKKDLVSEEDFKKVRAVINAIHPDAKVIETDHGKVAIEDVLATNSFDFEQVYASAGWCKQLEAHEEDDDDDDDHEHHHHDHDEHEEGDHEHEHHHHDDDDDHDHDEHGHHHEHHHHVHKHEGESEDEYGIGTFIYYRRKSFDRVKLEAFAAKWPRNIIRCKGLCWFDDEPEMAVVFETSGRNIQAGYSGQWIATAPKSEQKKILAENPKIAKDWDEEYGDRMIKLCIIGQKLDCEQISKDLDACLSK